MSLWVPLHLFCSTLLLVVCGDVGEVTSNCRRMLVLDRFVFWRLPICYNGSDLEFVRTVNLFGVCVDWYGGAVPCRTDRMRYTN